ncbi:hypothetical protein AAMO2058_000844300 [Amorphochlora amoebiformis]
MSSKALKIGVLALQGAFAEHIRVLKNLDIQAVEIRNPSELEDIDGLIIPGGESSTISLVAQRWNLITPLQKWITEDRPIFGTCAGMIFISKDAKNQKKHGQALLGKLDICVERNYFGRQNLSFETNLNTTLDKNKHVGIFIRAPGIVDVGKEVTVLATIDHKDKKAMPVAVRQVHLKTAQIFHQRILHP